MGDNIKNRKQLQTEYQEKYGDVSLDIWERLKNHLGDDLSEDLLTQAIDRVKSIRSKMTYSELSFTFYEVPIQSHRPRVNFHTRAMRTPNAGDNSKAIEHLVKDIRDELRLVCTPMKVILEAYCPMPSSVKPLEILLFETKHQRCVDKPDFDNILKAYCDMIQKHIILDDDLVCSSEIDKYYSLKPRVVMRIVFQDYFESEHTYKKIISRKRFKEQAFRIHAELIEPLPKKKKKKG